MVPAIMAVFALCCSSGVAAPVFRVDARASTQTVADGKSWSTAFADLQKAINAAADAGGGEIWVKSGVYKPEGSGRDSSFELRPGVHLFGGFRGKEVGLDERNPKANRTTLSGNLGSASKTEDNCFHVVTGATDSTLDGFIVSNGNADGLNQKGAGGGLMVPEGSRKMVVSGCTFEKNSATWRGGAIFSERVELSISNCTFSANMASGGGAVAIKGESAASISNSIFSSNTALTDGGAVMLEDNAEVEIGDCQFLYGVAHSSGGAVYAAGIRDGIRPVVEIRDSRFTANQADSTGGALHFKGVAAVQIARCGFDGNAGLKGTGAIDLVKGTLAFVTGCSFTENRGTRNPEGVFTDEDSKAFDSMDEWVAATRKEAQPTTPVPDQTPPAYLSVSVFRGLGDPVKLGELVASNTVTVLALGDLTDPDFIKNYRNIEAAAHDFRNRDIKFFYVYRALLHPENNGYIQSFVIEERVRQVQLAQSLLSTSQPWLFDSLGNQLLKELGTVQKEGGVFVFAKDGAVKFSGGIDKGAALRTTLQNLVGSPASSTSPSRFQSPQIPPLDLSPPVLLDRIRFNPSTAPFAPVVVSPEPSSMPFYAKLRAEADDKLLKTGNGRLYIGFHIDPLYNVVWDNRAAPLRYSIIAPVGTAAPASDRAETISVADTDIEPREFVLNTRQLDLAKPLMLQVVYSVFSPSQGKHFEVTQIYRIHLRPDPFGGQAYRRQIQYNDPPRNQNRYTIHPDLRDQDSNNDGSLTRDELGGKLRSIFPAIDTNGDGILGADEYNRYIKNK